MDYITNADQTSNLIPLNVSELNLLTNINMYYSGFSIDLLTLLAMDTGIRVITGDFNFNLLNIQQSRKVVSLC